MQENGIAKILHCMMKGVTVYPKENSRLGAIPVMGELTDEIKRYIKANKKDILKAFRDYSVSEIMGIYCGSPRVLARMTEDYEERIAIMTETLTGAPSVQKVMAAWTVVINDG